MFGRDRGTDGWNDRGNTKMLHSRKNLNLLVKVASKVGKSTSKGDSTVVKHSPQHIKVKGLVSAAITLRKIEKESLAKCLLLTAQLVEPGNPYWRERISTIELRVISLFWSAASDIVNIIYFFTKQTILMWRSSVLSLPFQLGFPGRTMRLFHPVNRFVVSRNLWVILLVKFGCF